MKVPIIRIPFTIKEKKELKNRLEDILDCGMLSMGKNTEEFEERYKDFVGTNYALAVNSGTAALEMILRSIGVEKKTVAIPSNTYMASALAAIHAGAKPVFIDCERENMQLSPDDLRDKLRDDTAAVMLVHIGGIISPRYYEIKRICGKKGIPLVEDAAHAHGATIDGKMAGNLGDAGAFSFYGTKVLTSGEGGMITTNRKDIYERCKILREHGKKDQALNIHVDLGHTWTISEFQSMVGALQVKKAKAILSARRKIAHRYDELLKDVKEIRELKIPVNIQPSYYKYIALLQEDIDREKLKKLLREKYNICLTGEVYSFPCHSQPVFKKYANKIIKPDPDTFKNTDYIIKHHICLPLYPGLSDKEIKYVVASIKKGIAEIR